MSEAYFFRLNGRLTSRVLASCALIVMTSLAGCSSGDQSATGGGLTTTTSPTPSKSLCATGSLDLIGSTAFLPVAQSAAAAYMRGCPGTTVNVSGGDSAYGLDQVRKAVAANSPAAGSMIGMYDGFPTGTAGLRAYPMGVLIYSIVAHTGLFGASSITTGELQKIFVKPGEQGKVAVGRRAGSGSRLAFDKNVLGLNPGSPDKGSCPQPTGQAASFTSCTEDSTAHLLDFVNGTPNAIGYAEVSKPGAGYPKISVLSIDNVAPTTGNVANGSYKFWTVEHLYAATQPTTLALDFLDFLSHYKGPNLPPDFIPCADAVKTLGAAC